MNRRRRTLRPCGFAHCMPAHSRFHPAKLATTRTPDIPADALARVKVGLAPYWGLYYRMVFNPSPLEKDDPVLGDLGDDLEDIYRDIQRGLYLYDGGSTEAAVWHWRFHHQIHWGQHASAAIYALDHYAKERRERTDER